MTSHHPIRSRVRRWPVITMGVFGGLARRSGLRVACAHHPSTQSRRHDGRLVGITPVRNHACITGADWNYPPHTITRSTTGNQHHERSYHVSTTSVPHHENRHNGRSRIARDGHKEGVPTTLPSRRTGWHSVAPPPIDRYHVRADSNLQKAPISGTRSGVNCMGLFGGNVLRHVSEN